MNKKSVPVWKITEPTQLPIALFISLFSGLTVFYKGNMLRARIKNIPQMGLARTIQVGNYQYVEQPKYTRGKSSVLSRNGKKIMWVIHEPTSKKVGQVMDGVLEKLP